MIGNEDNSTGGTPRVRPGFKRARWATALALVALVGPYAAYRLGVFTAAESLTASEAEEVRAPSPPNSATNEPPPRVYRHADFSGERASANVRGIADWVVDSSDNRGMPFVILDKVDAKLFVFNPAGHLIGASAALLGSARGDDSPPGIGSKTLAQITPGERTTPAGRFIAEPGVNLNGEEIVWVDYDAGVSIHAVRANNPRERRLVRLASPTPADNRISYGCINVPLNFFRSVVAPTIKRTHGVAYVLPETRPAHVVFNSYDVPTNAANAAGGTSTVALTVQGR